MTIKDIAKLAGVTHSTVSRSLNDSPLVSVETKERIKKIALEMGYSPNSFARKLVTKKSHTLGVFFLSRDELDFMENFGTQFLDGIATASHDSDYDLLFFTVTRDLSNRKSYIKMCREKQVEGAIFIGMTSDDPHLEEIATADFPICIIDFKVEGENVGFVSTDNVQGVHMALDYLWDCGHREIAYLGGPEHSPVAMTRENAFADYMRQKGVYQEKLIFRGNFSKASGYQKALEVMKLRNLPTALFAANDSMALGAIKSFKENGLRVPVDISVVGYDNAMAGEYSDPGLTTVGQNAVEMGASAVRFLLARMESDDLRKNILINPSLIIRESVRRIPLY